jgi:membrane-bound serine protease (ClpP class)
MKMKSIKHLIGCTLVLCGGLLAIFSAAPLEDDALVYMINIREGIGKGLRVYIQRGIREAEEANADAIIFDVNTPGGLVVAAVEIIDSIHRTNIPTIAYVNADAISAGAMISLSCDQIVMKPGGAIGDAAPVSIAPGGSAQEVQSEKIISYVRGKIKATAERQGKNPDIAATMVDQRLVLVRMTDGEIVALRPDAYLELKDAGEEMEVIVAEGELLTLTAEEATQYHLADGLAETVSDLLGMYQIVEINGTRKALTEEAALQKETELGTTRVQIIKSLENATVQEVAATLADKIVFFITDPMISAMLLALGGLGLFVEIRTPGFGVPGIIGLLCIGLFFGGHMLNQISAKWALIAFVLGIAFLLLEVFVIPGFGIAGIAGLTLMLGSVFYIFGTTYELETSVFWLSSSVIMTVTLAIISAYFLPKTRAWNKFVLATEMEAAQGYHSAGDEDFQSYLGQTGTALTPLRPAGVVRIGNKRIDALTAGDFIASESPIRVIEVEGSKIVVESTEE